MLGGGDKETEIYAAEKAARGRLSQAEASSRRQEGRRVAARADDEARDLEEETAPLIEGVRAANRQLDSLLGALDEAIQRLGGAAAPRTLPTPEPVREPAAPEPVREPAAPATSSPPSGSDSDGRGGASEGARLLATQMAVSGSDREEIEQRLRDEFGIKDAPAIVEEILGSD